METKKLNIIKCPVCEAEYLPGEIFYPNAFLGQPKDIEKDYLGKIIYSRDGEQNLVENFVCDKCNTKFTIEANVSYTVQEDKLGNINKEYTSKKYNGELFLEEN